MSNVGRTLTLVIKIQDHEKALEIWKSAGNPLAKSPLGFAVWSIAEGDKLKELDALEDRVGVLEDEAEFND